MRVAYFLIGATFLAGCATVSQMAATGGSRADGIVKLSFEAGMFDKIAIDEASALDTARRRCSTWGYTDAEPFGGHVRQCQQSSGYGCMRWFVTKEYQCTSSGSALVPASGPVQPIASAPRSAAPVAGGVHRVRANTASGYCLDVPDDYVGTGASNRPAVTSGMPRCSSLSAAPRGRSLR